MKIAVTGATGYIGSRLMSEAINQGHKVLALSRRRPGAQNCEWVPYELSLLQLQVLPDDTDVIVHLAMGQPPGDYEIQAAELLIKSAHIAGAKFIFVSSQTARPDAPTAYGRVKSDIEQMVLSSGGWVVRPGQVYGGALLGLFGALVSGVRRSPLLPAFIPAPVVQPIHVDDLVEGLLRISTISDVPAGVYCLASPNSIRFSTFLAEIAHSRLRRWRGFIPVPVFVINGLLFASGLFPRIRPALVRLRSLFELPLMATASDLDQIGLKLRPLAAGMQPSGTNRRRCLLLEGRALLTYIMKSSPSGVVLRRYVLMLEQVRDGKVMTIPGMFLRFPALLSLLIESAWADRSAGAEFAWRLDAATLLAEASPEGARRFLGIGSEYGALRSVLSMMGAVLSDVAWRLFRYIFSPIIRFGLNRAKGLS